MRGFAAKRAGREGLATSAISTQRLVPSGLCFDADPIIHCGPNALLAAEVSLRGLDGNVSEQELGSAPIRRPQRGTGGGGAELTSGAYLMRPNSQN